MISVAIPKMITQCGMLVQGREAIKEGLSLLLNTPCGDLWCDPAFGCNVRNRLFDTADRVTEVLMIEDIYAAIQNFAQYIRVSRDDITVTRRGRGEITISVKATSLLDYTTDIYNIDLTQM